MKIILAGTTGFVGQEVLRQCLANPSITSVVVLSRRPLQGASSPVNTSTSNKTSTESTPSTDKLKVLILTDFLSYSDDVVQELAGAEACVWTLATKPSKADATARQINLDYTMVAARTFAKHIAVPPEQQGNNNKKRFRFVYCSGAMAVRDQEQKLWYLQEARRLRGEVETQLLDLSTQNPDSFESTILKPALVMSPNDSILRSTFGWAAGSVKLHVLAAVMIRVALSGSERQILENIDINM